MAGAALQSANKYRSQHHNTPPLTYSNDLASKTQAYAELLLKKTIESGKTCLQHDPANHQDPKMGENLFYAMEPKSDAPKDLGHYAEKANESWYSEIKDWDFATSSKRPGGGATGHFTQLAWVETTKVGYGLAIGPQPGNPSYQVVFVVAKFQEPGNFQKNKDSYKNNVQPLKDASTLKAYTEPKPKPAKPAKSSTSSAPRGGSSSSTSISTSIVNGVKITTKTVKTVKNGEETVEVFENDKLKKKVVNGVEQLFQPIQKI